MLHNSFVFGIVLITNYAHRSYAHLRPALLERMPPLEAPTGDRDGSDAENDDEPASQLITADNHKAEQVGAILK